jgi:hypothetical protein
MIWVCGLGTARGNKKQTLDFGKKMSLKMAISEAEKEGRIIIKCM